MFKINLNKKMFRIIATLIIASNLFLTFYIYQQTQKAIQIRAFAKGETLKDYFISMRAVYHQQFINSGLEINDKTLGFLPAHASTLISEKFSQISKDKVTMRNVSDRPRNPTNMADASELEAIKYFKNNPNAQTYIQNIKEGSKDIIHYTSPLIIEEYCIKCHGKKEEVIPSIRERYDSAYDYKVGDIRGVTSVKIPIEALEQKALKTFYKMVFFTWFSTIFLLAIIYFAIKTLTKKDVAQKIKLEEEVSSKTAFLQKQKNELQHLFSVLKTVKDCNQILINAQNISELIEDTALSMHSNTTFAGVKIILHENGGLAVKSSIGTNNETEVTSIEANVFQNNRYIFLKNFEDGLHDECLEKVKKFGITEIYSLPLRKNQHAKDALGVITIYANGKEGLSKEERDMIDELAGDIGFAINSFYQKDVINQLYYYDPLTNLPNQTLFIKHLSQALAISSKNKKYGAILFMDFDNFKSVNDLMGQDDGNEVLKSTAERLISNFTDASIVSRYGSDKFLILFENISDKEDVAAVLAEHLGQEIFNTIKEPFILKDKTFYLTCSIGVTLFFDEIEVPQTLLNQAEYAMLAAKSDGRNIIRFHDQSLQDMTKSRSLMLQHLQEAAKEKQFFVLYQKQLNREEAVVGVEALIRWEHPTLGVVSPDKFIPLAEESGIIKKIGYFVLDTATDELALWANDSVKKNWRISVNVSPLQFKDKNFINEVKNLVTSKRINPNRLRLELTEGVLIVDQNMAMQKIEELNEFGISLSIDDFGTGYSSLGYLKHLKIDELKIDQSFVFGLHKNNSDRTIVKTIIMMGEEFNFEVIAEGVETREQFEILKNLGCDFFQGYLFAKPCKSSEL
ncbi:MAG: EAL domain-containing protein [Sulfurimonas sp.]|jgi:EAL domain-containing protein (putative c-di-GMP-specific phosphodiesterase class I)/GGDEF domain-containing protein